MVSKSSKNRPSGWTSTTYWDRRPDIANWTGQSGLATKTSHVQFLTSAVFQRLRQEGTTVAALMFNVKGADLLWLDKTSDPAEELLDAYKAGRFRALTQADRDAYKALGLEIEPFQNLRIFAPYKPKLESKLAKQIVRLEGRREPSKLNTQRNNPAETSQVLPILWGIKTLCCNGPTKCSSSVISTTRCGELLAN